jgi:hypothetical protein
MGAPPNLVLVVAVAVWWAVTAFNLGKTRSRIDKELKKMQ